MKRDTGRPTSDSRLELSGSGFLPGSAGAGPPAAKTFSSAGDLLYLQDLSRFTARSHCAVRVGGLGALGRGRGAAVEEGSSHGEACSPAGPTCDLMGRSWEGTVTIRTAALRFQCLGVRSVRSSRSNSPVRPGAESVSREQGSAGPRQGRPGTFTPITCRRTQIRHYKDKRSSTQRSPRAPSAAGGVPPPSALSPSGSSLSQQTPRLCPQARGGGGVHAFSPRSKTGREGRIS